MSSRLFHYVLTKTLPVMTGYVVLGIGFGVLSVKSGISVLMTQLMSILIYAGSMQFVMVGLITGGASVITIILTTLAVNARHLFYGISMVDRYQGTGERKPYLIFALTDETYSLVLNDEYPEGLDPTDCRFFISLADQIYWNLGTFIGAVLGSAASFNSEGIDFAMTALFITVATEQWLSAKDHRPALAGFFISTLCVWLFGESRFLIPAMAGIVLVLSLIGRKEYLPGREAPNE